MRRCSRKGRGSPRALGKGSGCLKSRGVSCWAVTLGVAVGLRVGGASDLPNRLLAVAPELPSYTIERVSAGISVDDVADEEDWRAASVIELIVPWGDAEGELVQRTGVRMLWSHTDLYIVYACEDPYIGAEIVDHDGPTYLEDAVEPE